jgi:hypothetical protein
MTMIDNKRPPKLYYFSAREGLERSLSLGEFRLAPPTPQLPSQVSSANDANYLILSLTQAWDGTLFDAVPDIDACLVVHNAEEFGERLHRAAQRILPDWAGIDAAVSYGAPSPLGRIFSKSKNHANENEWRFAWRPMQTRTSANPVVIRIGSIADIAELQTRHH